MLKKKTKKLDPRVERLLQLIIEARRARGGYALPRFLIWIFPTPMVHCFCRRRSHSVGQPLDICGGDSEG